MRRPVTRRLAPYRYVAWKLFRERCYEQAATEGTEKAYGLCVFCFLMLNGYQDGGSARMARVVLP